MQLNRRDLLKTLGAGVAVIAVPVTVQAAPDSRVWWSGWRDPMNQMITVGWWAAKVPADEMGREILISTTCGGLRRYRECDVIDVTYSRDWPPIGPWTTEQERAAVKARALARLEEALRG